VRLPCTKQEAGALRGGLWTHQDAAGRRFGQKYGNINFYGSVALWYFNGVYVRGVEPGRVTSS